MWSKFTKNISGLSQRSDKSLALKDFELWRNDARKLSCYYAPFDYTNHKARIILVGITPGRTQMNRALNAAKLAITNGEDVSEAIRAVKRHGSFSGNMRANIVNTLDRLGYSKILGIDTSRRLWESRDDLVHFCSLLKYPVFVNGKDYNGNPKMKNVPELRRMIIDEFVNDLASIGETAMIVPLGDTVATVIGWLDENGLIQQEIRKFEGRIVAPPHPSGANAESISLILRSIYPSLEAYQQQMYCDYLDREPWKKRRGSPQSEIKYKKARASRWSGALFIRRAHGID